MSKQEVVVKTREGAGTGDARRLRRSGYIPSVVYGMGEDARPVVVEPKSINKVIASDKGMNSVLTLRLEDTDKTGHVMIKDVERHPVTGKLMHVDFLRIDMDTKVVTTIPIDCVGSPEGVKLGGVLTIVRHEIEIECLPKDMPGSIKVDVTHLNIDDAIRIGDLPQLEGVEYQLGPKRTVAVVHPPDQVKAVDDEEDDVDVDETPVAAD